jgi:hypothetical protein
MPESGNAREGELGVNCDGSSKMMRLAATCSLFQPVALLPTPSKYYECSPWQSEPQTPQEKSGWDEPDRRNYTMQGKGGRMQGWRWEPFHVIYICICILVFRGIKLDSSMHEMTLRYAQHEDRSPSSHF